MRKLLIGLVAVAAAGSVSSAAQAEAWRTVAETDSHPYTMMFVDQASLSLSGQTATAWVMTVMEDQADRDWSHSIIFRHVDCQRGVTQMVHSKFYDGATLLEDNTTPADWQTIREGSMVDGVADVMCGRAAYTSEVVNDPVGYSFAYFKTK